RRTGRQDIRHAIAWSDHKHWPAPTLGSQKSFPSIAGPFTLNAKILSGKWTAHSSNNRHASEASAKSATSGVTAWRRGRLDELPGETVIVYRVRHRKEAYR